MIRGTEVILTIDTPATATAAPTHEGRYVSANGTEIYYIETGPADAERTVLLLPGGLMNATSYAELMAQPSLAGIRLVAVTLPGHAGTPPPEDFSIESYARLAAELAASLSCDVVVGFSIGATVAFEMAMSGAFEGPVVLLGISLSSRDEPMFLHAINRLGFVLGSLPAAALLKMFGMAGKGMRVSVERRAELLGDLRKNDPRAMRRIFRAYLKYLGRSDPPPATRLCNAGVPAWVMHAEKGDGGLTDEERRILETCPTTTVVTVPGASFLLPNEDAERVAGLVVQALARAARAPQDEPMT
jgi:pimeloyl-ACP methyl ester carboxylesterase